MQAGTMQAKTNSDADRLLFYQSHLDRVSRSFAFCIERLESPLRAQVSLAYLLCRILDTIEDAPWDSWGEQRASFAEFESFLKNGAPAVRVREWIWQFPSDLPEGEQLLLQDAAGVFADFHGLPEKVQAVFREAIGSMANGMWHFMERSGEGPLRLSSLVEVNQYCFFVAGVVGEILTRVLTEQNYELGLSDDEISRLSLMDAYRFGLFLQKVNLLKDQRHDETVGRFLVHSREEVFASLKGDAEGAIRYVTNLPERFVGYRLFCSWSLFLGLASLPYIERSYREDLSAIKITREETRELLGQVEEIIRDDKALRALFEEMLSEAASGITALAGAAGATPMANAASSCPELEKAAGLYRGALTRAQVASLFLNG